MVLRTRLLLAFILLTSSAYAQSDSLFIALIGKVKKDGVWLRWAPTSPLAWQFGVQNGYVVERFTLLPNGDIENPLGERLNDTPIKPYPQQELAQLSQTIKEVAVIHEVLYGEDAVTVPVTDDPRSLLARNQEMENRFGMALLVCDLSTQVAQSAGLFLLDKTAQKGKRYIYRISIAGNTPVAVQPGIAMVVVTDEKPMLQISDLKAEFRDRAVALSWSTLLHRGIYSGYYIEKSTDGKTFKRVMELPFVYMSDQLETERANFVDSLDVNNKTYYYRIMGISTFAELSPPSNIVSGMGKDDLTGLLIIREAVLQERSKNVKIAWEFPVAMEYRVASFVISKSTDVSGPYEDSPKKLTPPTRTSIDVAPFNNTYFMVKAIDKSGNELCHSFPYMVLLPDSIPPGIPMGLSGKIDKDGIVSLQWNSNTEPDLLGYRVFYANNPNHEFTEATTEILSNPEFSDTIHIRVLNKAIYYSTVSVDKNYNPSDLSKPLKLLRPDIIAPSEPAFTKTGVQNGHIHLEWAPSVSHDVASYTLRRQEAGDTVKTIVLKVTAHTNTSSFTDNTATLGKAYRYTLTARDSAGNSSETITGKIVYETGVRPAITNFTALVDRDNKQITLRWKNPGSAIRYILYRKINDGDFILYQTTEDGAESLQEKRMVINNTYTYKIQAVYPKGVKSALSDELVVKF